MPESIKFRPEVAIGGSKWATNGATKSLMNTEIGITGSYGNLGLGISGLAGIGGKGLYRFDILPGVKFDKHIEIQHCGLSFGTFGIELGGGPAINAMIDKSVFNLPSDKKVGGFISGAIYITDNSEEMTGVFLKTINTIFPNELSIILLLGGTLRF